MAFDNWVTSDKNSITENNGTNMKLIPDWSGLSRIGRNKIMQYTVLVPVFGYFIIFSDWLRENLTIYNEFPEWNLYFTYYGLTFLAVASLIYGFRCPNTIKHYTSQAEFIEHEIKTISRTRLFDLLLRANETYTTNRELLSNEVWLHMDRLKERGEEYRVAGLGFYKEYGESVDRMYLECVDRREHHNKNELSARELLSDHYKRSDKFSPLSRQSVFILYLIGFTLLAIPTLSMFSKVLYRTIQMML